MGRKTQHGEQTALINIKFNEKIYTLKSIRESAKVYAELAKFEIKKQKPYIQVKIKSGGEVSDMLLKDEFCNYVLSMLKTADA